MAQSKGIIAPFGVLFVTRSLQVKICGITTPAQGCAIAQLGATALGLMCVPQSPRYVTPEQIRHITTALFADAVVARLQPMRIGVFVDAEIEAIAQIVHIGNLNAVQLHGNESPQFCLQVRQVLPEVGLIKALRIRDRQSLERSHDYAGVVDTLLLDAYHPTQYGGTGKTLDWSALQKFRPDCAWWLAGGLNPDNVLTALSLLQPDGPDGKGPDGIDLSSGVERSPGDKDLEKVARLFAQLETRQAALPG